MELIYWIFIPSVIIATFFVIFRRLSALSYLTMTLIVLLYIIVLIASIFIK
ncbi:hypothetical protein [Halobacillus sp. Marseille-Q1614]|uniref:hypothetical protein n=1 Tax=Halobacillus sp. Marseille-Q1614 TaxID=2709134 RepID=UPI00156DD87F|nr:hypothetical protein [Halobacillus sp. Marseille-Q1614]